MLSNKVRIFRLLDVTFIIHRCTHQVLYSNQAARAENNNTVLRVLKANLPRQIQVAQTMMKYQKCDCQRPENYYVYLVDKLILFGSGRSPFRRV